MARFGVAVAKGVADGLLAGVPQVVLTQIETGLLGMPREQADIGPRFVRRVAQGVVGRAPSPPTEWLLATLFHFGYAAQWGVFYALIQELRPTPPLIGGSMLAGLIYTLAFSPLGAATQTRTERAPERRPLRETVMHWTAALSFSLTTAYAYAWLRRRSEAEPGNAEKEPVPIRLHLDREPLTPQPLRGANIGCADVPLPYAGEGENSRVR